MPLKWLVIEVAKAGQCAGYKRHVVTNVANDHPMAETAAGSLNEEQYDVPLPCSIRRN